MKTLDDVRRVIEDYEKLIRRAGEVRYIREADLARVKISDGECVVLDPEVDEDGYGAYWVGYDEARFPAEVLLMTDEELAQWQVAEEERQDRARREQAAAWRAEKERREREALAALKAKYETP